MALATVRFHPAAVQEAESAYDWYAPRHGRRTRRYVFPLFPFSLVHRIRDDEVRIRDDEVEVVAVAHGRRRPGYWRSRL